MKSFEMVAKPRGKAIKAWKSLHKTLFLALLCASLLFISASTFMRGRQRVSLGLDLSDDPSKQENFKTLLEPISFLLLGHGANFSNHGTSSCLLRHLQDCSWSTDQRRSHFYCRPSTHCIDGKYKNSKAFANFRNFALKAQYKRSGFGVDYEQLRLFMNIIKRNLVQKAIDCVAGSLQSVTVVANETSFYGLIF